MLRSAFTTLVALGVVLLPAVASAQSPKKSKAAAPAAVSQIPTHVRLNAWTIGLAAGRTEGAPLRFAAELARELDDEHEMRVIPMVTRGPFDNVFDLLHLRGVDLAIVSGDILDFFQKDPAGPAIAKKLAYVMPMVPAEIHILARPEINAIEDLVGKAVNFNSKGTQAAYTGPILFERLGLKIEQHFIPHHQALAEMQKDGKFAATFWVSSKPLDPLVKRKFPEGFKLLTVPATDKLLEYYFPTYLEAADYPGLIPAGQRVETLAVPTVLAAFNWPKDTDRYRRQQRFVDYLVKRLPNLQSRPGNDPKWKDINLAATVPGWQRLPLMQQRLDAMAAAAKTSPPPAEKRADAPLKPAQ
ncbi:MAG: TAXI family TRAP transporter solute-binding subunit [Hyphomicrobiaceae bacterium]